MATSSFGQARLLLAVVTREQAAVPALLPVPSKPDSPEKHWIQHSFCAMSHSVAGKEPWEKFIPVKIHVQKKAVLLA